MRHWGLVCATLVGLVSLQPCVEAGIISGTEEVVGGAVQGTGEVVEGTGEAVTGNRRTYGGYDLSERDRQRLYQVSPRTLDRLDRGQELRMNDIKAMSQAGLSDRTIIGAIQYTGSSFNLSKSQIRSLRNAGVSDRVVDYMVNTGTNEDPEDK